MCFNQINGLSKASSVKHGCVPKKLIFRTSDENYYIITSVYIKQYIKYLGKIQGGETNYLETKLTVLSLRVVCGQVLECSGWLAKLSNNLLGWPQVFVLIQMKII